MTDPFVHLHCHSEYSLLDGLGRIDDLVRAAVAAEMPAIALTDHGTMFGAIEFIGKAKDAGIKPIVGCEVYVSDQPIGEKPKPGAKNYHLVLLAENERGYRNLIRLTSEAHLRGFYRKPRVDHALLEECNDGLICLSACASSELNTALIDGRYEDARQVADWYHQIFGDRYYLEIQEHGLDFDQKLVEDNVRLARELGLPLVATNDVHYVQARHAYTHEVLLCIQTQTTMSDPKRMRLETGEFYLKSPDQMRDLFGQYPESLTNTLAIAERCDLQLTFGRPQLPRVQTPEGQTSEEYLRALCEAGLRRRYSEVTAEIRDRLEYEYQIICKTGFVDYFLLVYDVISFARGAGIAVGPGRGSAAGSLVAYVLFLTNIDPIAHGLSFERFLNPERVTMPDMDLDFADDRRDEVIQHVTEKYGRDKVAQIITFGTLGARAGVRDVGRALGMPYGDTDRVAKLIPFMCSKVSKAKEESPELAQLYSADSSVRQMLDIVEDLEGVARHASTHAAGVVISRDPMMEHVPLYKVPKSDQITTQYAMSSIEKIGLLKMDFLGLRTLTILQRTRDFIEQSTGREFDLDSIPLDHPSIYELLGTGETFGVFQVDGQGMRKLLRDLRPTQFSDIVAAIALYRPGPMENIPSYIARSHGQEEVHYEHPALEAVLKETHGIFVYQEQVMRLFNLVAGYSLGEADLVRRAMAKKKIAELNKHKSAFLERAAERGTSNDAALRLWDIVEPFAGYAFNKSHAAAYAVITCQTAYLKANYPREYFAGLLSAERENTEKVAEGLAECRRLGIQILPPDINDSETDFALDDNGIRVGLGAIKHVGSAAVESVIAERRENGRFKSLEDFCQRVDWTAMNKRVLESLVRVGAFDRMDLERGRLLAHLDRIVSFGTQAQRNAAAGQISLFGEIEEPEALLQLPLADPATIDDRIAWERELLGTHISPHPFTDAEAGLMARGALLPRHASPEHHGKVVMAAGMIQGLRSFTTKDGRPMASFRLDDLQGNLEVVVFSRTYETVQHALTDQAIVVVQGRVDGDDNRLRVVAEDVVPLEELGDRSLAPVDAPAGRNGNGGNGSRTAATSPPAGSHRMLTPSWRLTIEVRRGADRQADLQRIVSIYACLQRFPGGDEVEIVVRQGPGVCSLPLPNPRVGWCEQLQAELRKILTDESWRLVPVGSSAASSNAA